MKTELQFADDERLRKVTLALVELEGIDWGRAAEVAPEALFEKILGEARASGTEAFGPRIKAVRDMLRNGRYKPAGRAKPSSEYLLAAALDGSFPRVNPFVDAINLASLKYMYPMSIFDADKAGRALWCRLGAPGERYVFNGSGQEIDVEDLVCLCAAEPAFAAPQPARGTPIVNPVRDSMATKLFEGAHNGVVVVYAPGGPYGAEGTAIASAARDLAEWCGHASGMAEIKFASLS
jgi:DNA/RNA-binding domain of Phe-tRNA-synthetase-like protein